MLLLGYACDVDERAAIARIDGKCSLEEVLGLLELACGDQVLCLMLQLNGLRKNLVVRTLARDRRRKGKPGDSNEAVTASNSPCRRQLTRSAQPRDEKAIGPVVAGREQPSRTIQTPCRNGRFLHNPR